MSKATRRTTRKWLEQNARLRREKQDLDDLARTPEERALLPATLLPDALRDAGKILIPVKR